MAAPVPRTPTAFLSQWALRAMLWVLALFALAVGLVVAARYNAGYVLIAFPTYRVEVSLTFAVLLLAIAFGIGYALMRGVAAALRLPADVRRFHEERRAKAGRSAFTEALQAFFEGRYGRAEKAAARALSLEQAPALSAVIAARAAHETRAFDARDRYLNEIEADENADYLRRITHAELLLDERRYLDALAVLGGIGDRHTAALRLELKAHQLARNWDQVAALLPLLEKRRVYDPVVLSQIRRSATAELLKRQALDAVRLREAWSRLPDDLARDEIVARAAAEAFLQFDAADDAGRVVEQALAHHWDSQLVLLYAEGKTQGNVLARIEKAEGWLPQHARDAALLLTLGRLCARAALWGKARSYFEASLAVESSHTAHLELARLAEEAGRADDAAAHRKAALDQVLGQLGETTGGRRKRLL